MSRDYLALIERLQREGSDAFHKHYSLGMFNLCDEAAQAILELLVAVSDARAVRSPIAHQTGEWDTPFNKGFSAAREAVHKATDAALTKTKLEPLWHPIASAQPFTRHEERGIYSDDGTPGLFHFKATHWRPAAPRAREDRDG